MIDVKTAVRAAMKYLQNIQEFVPADGLRLEETEHEDSGDWLITLSTFDEAELALPRILPIVGGKRVYKIFRIDGETGEVKSMKVRTLQPIE
jgi:hypothetical protein